MRNVLLERTTRMERETVEEWLGTTRPVTSKISRLEPVEPAVVAAPVGAGGWSDGMLYWYCMNRTLSLSSGIVTHPQAPGGRAGLALVGQGAEEAKRSCWS